jgi:phytoene dehydrogenase-like protein
VRSRGWWREGPDALVRVLENAATRAGVTIRTSAEVARIDVQDDVVKGVVLASGEEIHAARVLSSADPAKTLLGMIDPVWLDPEFMQAIRNIRFRGSTAFVLYALDDLPALDGMTDTGRALAGTLTLTATMPALELAFDAAKYGAPSERPHVELTAPTLRWPDLAPSGKHVLVARASCAPHTLRDGQWDASSRERFADDVTREIGYHARGFANRVLHRVTIVPPDIAGSLNCTEGAASHGEMMLDQILFMRPVAGWGDHAMPVAGLFLCGSGAHPGPGISGGAGWLAARRALTRTRER